MEALENKASQDKKRDASDDRLCMCNVKVLYHSLL